MSKKQGDSVTSADLLGLVLFGGGMFIAVVVGWALHAGIPAEGARANAKVAAAVISALGAAPALLLSISLAVLGARLFVGRRPVRNLGQHLSGILGVAIGLAVLLGALSPLAGGVVGDTTGGFLARKLSLIPGVLFGVVALALPIWLAWLRDSGLVPAGHSKKAHLDLGVSSEEEPVGVSAAEAQALLPTEEPTPKPTQMDETAASLEARPAWAFQSEAQDPYPEDVRRKGEIPAGAQPLHDPSAGHDERDSNPDEQLHEWTPAEVAEPDDSFDEDLAVPSLRIYHSGEVEEELGEPQPLELDETVSPEDVARAELREAGELLAEPLATPLVTEPVTKHVESSRPRPSWETEEDTEASEEDEWEYEEAEASASEEEDADWEYEDAEELEEDELVASPQASEEEDEEELEDDEEYEYVEVSAEAEEDAEELEEDELVASPQASEEEDEEELEDDEEWEYEYVEVDEYEEVDESDLEEEPVQAEQQVVEAAPAEPESAPEEAPAPAEEPAAPVAKRSGEVQMDLFAEEPDQAQGAVQEPELVEDEPIVELQPQAAQLTPSERALKAAHLILGENRVAVSMLQRQFELDFKESCKILDELQDLGFIGPYVDGNSRDILMTREEWLAAVGTH